MIRIEDATKNEIHGRLLIKGMRARDFAKKHGFKTDTVFRVIARHSGKLRARRGALTKQIIKKLEEEIG